MFPSNGSDYGKSALSNTQCVKFRVVLNVIPKIRDNIPALVVVILKPIKCFKRKTNQPLKPSIYTFDGNFSSANVNHICAQTASTKSYRMHAGCQMSFQLFTPCWLAVNHSAKRKQFINNRHFDRRTCRNLLPPIDIRFWTLHFDKH